MKWYQINETTLVKLDHFTSITLETPFDDENISVIYGWEKSYQVQLYKTRDANDAWEKFNDIKLKLLGDK